MKAGALAPEAFSDALAGRGLRLSIGPAVFHLTVPVRDGHAALQRLYAHHSLAAEDAFTDTYIACLPRMNPRHLWERRVKLYIDGAFHAAVKFARLSVPAIEWTMNWSIATKLHQFVIIHSAVVERGGRAVILPGPPGSGKSTLCAALVLRGWRLLSDEFVLIRPADGELAPCPRPISLKERSIAVLRELAPHAVLDQEFPGTSKGTIGYVIPPQASVEAQHVPASPAAVVFPTWRSGAPPCLTPIPQGETFVALTMNGVNYELMGETGFRVFTRLVQNCPGYRFEYASLDDAVQAIERLVG